MKPQVAFYWCASCGGCEEAVLDLGEKILDVVAAVDIVFWPVALDFKKHDVERLADGSLAAVFMNGAVRSSEQEEMAHLLRRKAQTLIAFGSCAHLGGIPGLANLYSRAALLEEVYSNTPSTVNPERTRPETLHRENGYALSLPVLDESVRALDRVVDVDYYLPGCAPTAKIVAAALEALLSGNLPPKGSVLAPDHALCEECPRRSTRPEKLLLAELRRPQHVLAAQDQCLLAQGLLCLGPATRAGCEALCVNGNMPCTGCFGPTSRVRDYGAKALAAIASILDANQEAAIDAALAGVPDPAGSFYRYSLPAALVEPRRT